MGAESRSQAPTPITLIGGNLAGGMGVSPAAGGRHPLSAGVGHHHVAVQTPRRIRADAVWRRPASGM
ncbi:hypothetical protein [Microbacterium sp. 179-I 3D4 NHS]|uniref:hypothetical protein n=1 Tax=Microbacterium sp. 179-I 3D4 NHS TaxID=3142381 RepID=UPI0039A3779D